MFVFFFKNELVQVQIQDIILIWNGSNSSSNSSCNELDQIHSKNELVQNYPIWICFLVSRYFLVILICMVSTIVTVDLL